MSSSLEITGGILAQGTPHDVMSAIYPKPVRSLARTLQEGALVALWVIGAGMPPVAIEVEPT